MGEPQRVNALEIFPEPRLAGSPPRVFCSQVGVLSSQMVAMTVASLSCGAQPSNKRNLKKFGKKAETHQLKPAHWLTWARQA